jgi:hypothetical protein
MCANNEPFGLTDEEYQFLNDERNRIIEENVIDSFDRNARARAQSKAKVDSKESEKTNYRDQDKDGKKKKIEKYILKHSGNGLLAEAIIINRKACFAVSRVNDDNEVRITLEDSIDNETATETFLPLQNPMSRPFTFKSEEEFYDFIEKANIEDLDSLYKKVKSIWQKYIDADDFHISLCAADAIFTYFQDKMGLTHYLFFVGGNDTGKSNNLTVIEYVGYRAFKSVGITSANIYTFLGNKEEGQGTICEDEADNIDRDPEKMKIYKGGYQIGNGVARTDLPNGKRSQNKWNTFGWKAFAAERLPDLIKAKGFHQRIIPLHCDDGDPHYDIAEVVSAEDEDEFQPLLNELNEAHNLLLAYKLLNFHYVIPNIKLSIRNREKQLFKPLLRVFQNTRTYNELKPVVSYFINQRRENNANSFHAFLYRVINELTKLQNSYELVIGSIWQSVKNNLEGEDIPNRPLSYDSSDFGKISQKEITEILIQVFGAKRPKHHGATRKLIFNKDKLTRLERKYNLSAEVNIVADGTDGTDGTGIGLDAHLLSINYDKEITEIRPKSNDTSYNSDKTNQEVISRDLQESPKSSVDASQASQASQEKAGSNNINNSTSDIVNGIYKDLIDIQPLPNLGRNVYTCKEHPEVAYYELEGIENSHFKPYHGINDH